MYLKIPFHYYSNIIKKLIMTLLSIRDFLNIDKKVIENISTTAIKCDRNDPRTLVTHRIFRYLKWIEKEVHRREVPHSFSYDEFVSNLVKRCNIPEQSLNKNAIITYESDIIKLCFMYKVQFTLVIKLKSKKVIKEIKIEKDVR